ncbi:hypothetical protein [Bacillus toyonensis]|uniref:Uncharacterized protein n=1 Tax=uncultured Caudovirales phage TaxID=2100421 RepID=A0A2H4JFX9_9CAUD|nr:hypothetical protein [Bacillus toyonensis]ASN71431.1 hypothetical protein 3F9_24 [uncultured Caudovirales phage]MDR4969788.1 hypothetical protein [Bacillus toyonensis]PHB34513.1 hypothetical protein COE86_17750 [Bacillus toyonensis]
MSSNNFFPAITSINLFTQKDSSELILYKGQDNVLHVSCTIDGLTRRTLPYIHESLDYIAIWFTLYHQFGGRETTIVRRYFVEFDPKEWFIPKDIDRVVFEIPVDDDFSDLDFISNYYYLQISFTGKRPHEMGIEQSIHDNQIFNTKIPFVIKEVL